MVAYQGSLTFYTDKDGKLQYEKDIQSDLVVTYIGDEEKLFKVKKLVISYKSLSSGGTLTTESFSVLNETSFSFPNAAGGALLEKDTVITVTINMDGVLQTIELVDE